jgi:hypothetical protein
MENIMGSEKWVNEGQIVTDTKRVLAALNRGMPGTNWTIDASSGHYQATTSLSLQAAQRVRNELLHEPLVSSISDLRAEGIGELIAVEAVGNGSVQMRIHIRGIRQHGLEGLEAPDIVTRLKALTQSEVPQQQKPKQNAKPTSSHHDMNSIELPASIPGGISPGVGRR